MEGHCHCGAVRFELKERPAKLTDCNCSICRRLAALWAHAPIAGIAIHMQDDATLRYVWGDKMLAFHTCRTCGCTTHWENLRPDGDRMAVNCRLVEPAELEGIRVRRLDGADTWKFLD
ncbi:MAG: GFA family protein [Myxococcales bacterium]|nr:GFA family protein [Myxococcales bacterium]